MIIQRPREMTSDSSPKLQDIGRRAFRDMPTGELDSTKLFDPLARVLLPEVDVSRATPALIRESLVRHAATSKVRGRNPSRG